MAAGGDGATVGMRGTAEGAPRVHGIGDSAGAGSTPILEAEGLRHAYGGRPVVDVDRLRIETDEVVAVLGPNGAGKSTLLRLLLGLERPSAGEVRLNGRSLADGDEALRRRMVGVLQRPELFSGTVRFNLRFGLRARGVPRGTWADRCREVAAELGIGRLLDADVTRLSGGEAQRVALARALVLEPDALLLDEPTASLDVTVRRRFREELGTVMRERARSVLLITHDPSDAFDLADRVYVMEGGRFVQVGTPEDLTTTPATPFVAAFTGAELLLDGTVERISDGTLDVSTGAATLVARCTEGRLQPGDRIHVRYRPEDVILTRTGEPDTSARNRLRMTVRSVTPVGGMVRVRLEGPITLVALVTRGSADRLGITPGSEIVALLKTAALAVYLSERA